MQQRCRMRNQVLIQGARFRVLRVGLMGGFDGFGFRVKGEGWSVGFSDTGESAASQVLIPEAVV